MLLLAIFSAGLATMYHKAMRDRQGAIRARPQAEQAMRNAELARMQDEQAFKAVTEEDTRESSWRSHADETPPEERVWRLEIRPRLCGSAIARGLGFSRPGGKK